jgi:hypothetical protein
MTAQRPLAAQTICGASRDIDWVYLPGRITAYNTGCTEMKEVYLRGVGFPFQWRPPPRGAFLPAFCPAPPLSRAPFHSIHIITKQLPDISALYRLVIFLYRKTRYPDLFNYRFLFNSEYQQQYTKQCFRYPYS